MTDTINRGDNKLCPLPSSLLAYQGPSCINSHCYSQYLRNRKAILYLYCASSIQQICCLSAGFISQSGLPIRKKETAEQSTWRMSTSQGHFQPKNLEEHICSTQRYKDFLTERCQANLSSNSSAL